MEAYLDNAATTRVFPEVREMMVHVMEEDFGNPSSKHTKRHCRRKLYQRSQRNDLHSIKMQTKRDYFYIRWNRVE